MDLKKILGNIGCAALGTITAPFGGMAVNVVRKVLGLKENSTEKEVIKAIEAATPEQLLALKKADNKFTVEMKKLDIDLVKIDKEDVKEARGFAERIGIRTVNALAFSTTMLVVLTVLGVGFLIYKGSLDAMTAIEASLLTLIVREAFAKQEQVYNFFFGSSSGSKSKTDLMGKK